MSAINTSVANRLNPDAMDLIYTQLLSKKDCPSFSALACTNTNWNQSAKAFCGYYPALRVEVDHLDILDAKAQGVVVDDEPLINPAVFKFLGGVSGMQIGDRCGFTLLTLCKGMTLNKLSHLAADVGMKIILCAKGIREKFGNEAVEHSYRVLIAKNPPGDFRISFADRKTFVNENGCEPPTLQEGVALWVFTNRVFKKYLFWNGFLSSSTRCGGFTLAIGAYSSAPQALRIDYLGNVQESCTVGARLKLKS